VSISKTTLKKFSPQGTTPLGFSFWLKSSLCLDLFPKICYTLFISTGQVEQHC